MTRSKLDWRTVFSRSRFDTYTAKKRRVNYTFKDSETRLLNKTTKTMGAHYTSKNVKIVAQSINTEKKETSA